MTSMSPCHSNQRCSAARRLSLTTKLQTATMRTILEMRAIVTATTPACQSCAAAQTLMKTSSHQMLVVTVLVMAKAIGLPGQAHQPAPLRRHFRKSGGAHVPTQHQEANALAQALAMRACLAQDLRLQHLPPASAGAAQVLLPGQPRTHQDGLQLIVRALLPTRLTQSTTMSTLTHCWLCARIPPSNAACALSARRSSPR